MNRQMLWVVGCVAAVTLGCGSKDKSKVLATVGSEKLTEQVLEQHIRVLAPTEKEAKEFLSPERKAEREQFVDRLVQLKTMAAFGKLEGLEKDPKAKILVEQAVAQTYMQLLMERRLAGLTPTEAQLKADYDAVVAQAKEGDKTAVIPPFETPMVKEQLTQRWKQKQSQVIQAALIKEMETKVKVVRAK